MKDYDDLWLTSHDGLRLYARDYAGSGIPEGFADGVRSHRGIADGFREGFADGVRSHGFAVVCMHGLTRNAADFEALAQSLEARYRLIVMDQRGRGRSDRDPNPANYNVMTYVADTFALLDQLQLAEVVLIGTSMGGLMAMLMASQRPERIRGVVLNDVGPVVEAAGIARIQGYVGKSGEITSWADAAQLARANNELAFPNWNDDDWLTFAARLFVENESGVPVLAYDPAISQPLSEDQTSAVPPDMWPVFDAMSDTPTLAIRGELSDILSRQTIETMALRHHNLMNVEVPGRGHAPMLDEPEAFAAIERFLATL